ncbi:MAG: hypothetical protein Q4G67_11625 [Actinomycetia bacterium]|nr:hypothetical protein [Actinomycetes bacterium]
MGDSTYVARSSRWGSFDEVVGYLDHYDDTFNASDSRYFPGKPLGRIDRANQVFSGVTGGPLVGHLASDGEIYSGHEFSTSKVLRGKIVGDQLIDSNGRVVLQAEGTEAARALTAAWLLLGSPVDTEEGARSGGVAAATALMGALQSRSGRPSRTSGFSPQEIPTVRQRPQRTDVLETRYLKDLLKRQNRYAIAEAPRDDVRPEHLKSGRFSKWKVGTHVSVTRFRWEGVGRIAAIAVDGLGGGTKLFPAYLVEFWDGSQDWYSASSLTKLTPETYSAEVSKDPRRIRPRPDFERTPNKRSSAEPESIVGFCRTSPSAAFSAAYMAGYRPVALDTSSMALLVAQLAGMPRGAKGDRLVPIVVAHDIAMTKHAMNGISNAVIDGVDVAHVILIHPDPDVHYELGVAVTDLREPPREPMVMQTSAKAMRELTQGWVRVVVPDLAALPASLRGDVEETARAVCAILPLTTSDLDHPSCFAASGDREIFDDLAPRLESYTLAVYVPKESSDGHAPGP